MNENLKVRDVIKERIDIILRQKFPKLTTTEALQTSKFETVYQFYLYSTAQKYGVNVELEKLSNLGIVILFEMIVERA